MKPKTVILNLIILFVCVSCSKVLGRYRLNEFSSKGDEWKFYNAIYRRESEEVEKMLQEGADPDYCKGEEGWIDSNPLSVVVQGVYSPFWRRKMGETIPEITPDITILQLLLDFGADINRYPYVWQRVYFFGNKRITDYKKDINMVNEAEEQIDDYINSTNRILQAFLEAGADPDMLGDPRPYTYAKPFRPDNTINPDYPMNDEKARAYFLKGTRPVNEAIKKGMIWESQVDLLLKYTDIDKDSLEAAKESGDPAMIEKINKLWEKHDM